MVSSSLINLERVDREFFLIVVVIIYAIRDCIK